MMYFMGGGECGDDALGCPLFDDGYGVV